MPCSRHKSATGTPPSAWRRVARIWGSLYLVIFIPISSFILPRKFYFRGLLLSGRLPCQLPAHSGDLRFGETAFVHVVCSIRLGRLYIRLRKLPGGRSEGTHPGVTEKFVDTPELAGTAVLRMPVVFVSFKTSRPSCASGREHCRSQIPHRIVYGSARGCAELLYFQHREGC